MNIYIIIKKGKEYYRNDKLVYECEYLFNKNGVKKVTMKKVI